jgi:hypothetical protein
MGRIFVNIASQIQVEAIFLYLVYVKGLCFCYAKIMQNQRVAMNWREYYTLSDSYICHQEKAPMQIRQKISKIVQ